MTEATTSGSVGGGATVVKDLSLEEKQRLAATINEMQMSGLLGVVHILMKHVPELKDQAGQELKIDLDSLDPEILRELDAYCKNDAGASGASFAVHEPTPKKAKTERAPDSAEKMFVLSGCERLLRAHGQPLSAFDLVLQGTDAGYFNFSGGAALPDKQLTQILQSDIKSGKKVFENSGGGKFGLVEFGLYDEAKEAHVANRNQFLATVPTFPMPASQAERDLLRCKYVHNALWKNPNVWIFEKPVDAEALKLPDYHKIILEPMDLGTVKQRLHDGWYKSFDDYKREVMLVWSNAMKYNPPQDPVHQMAAEYQQQTLRYMKEYGLPVEETHVQT